MILNKYKNISLETKASFWFLLANIIQKSLFYISIPIFTRLMTVESYGEFNFYNSLLIIVTVFTTFNLSWDIVNTGLTKYSDDKDSFISSLQWIITAGGIFAGIVIYFSKSYLPAVTKLEPVIFLLMILQIYMATSYEIWMAKKKFEFQYIKIAAVTIVTSISVVLISIIAVKQYPTTLMRIFSMVCVYAIAYTYLIFLNFKKAKPKKEYIKYGLVMALPLIPFYLSKVFINQIDKILIGKFASYKDVAIFSIGFSIGFIINIVSQSINSAILPRFFLFLKAEQFVEIQKMILRWLILLSGIIMLIVGFSKEFLLFSVPAVYQSALYIIPTVSFSVFLQFLSQFVTNILLYHEKKKILSMLSIVIIPLKIGLTIFFIYYYSIVWVPLSMVAINLILLIFMYNSLKKLLGKERMRTLFPFSVSVFQPAILVLGLLIVSVLSNQFLLRVAAVTAFECLYIWQFAKLKG